MKVSANLHLSGGDAIRFGPDESDPGDVPASRSFGTEVPGWGFAEGAVVLKRPERITSLDAELFERVTFDDEAGRRLYEGRVAGTPRVGADAIELDLEGLAAHLDDNETVREIYRDIDLGAWGDAPASRVVAQRLAGYVMSGSVEQGWDTAAAKQTLTCAFDRLVNASAANCRLASEPYYDGQGIPLGSIAYNLTCNLAMALGGATWKNDLYAMTAEAGAVVAQAALDGAGGVGTLTIPEGASTALIDCYYNAVFTGDGSWAAMWRDLAVYGRHGLTKYGTEPEVGFLPGDIIRHAVETWAPLIDVGADAIEPSAFIVPHLAYKEDTTVRSVIEAMCLYGATGNVPPDYGVYEDGLFVKTPGNYGRTWRLRRDQGVIPADDGPTSEERCNGYKIRYTDAGGVQRSVGPPGSRSDFETADLFDPTPTNPVNAAGIPARYKSKDVGITSRAGAILIGRLLMAEANAATRRGSFTAQGDVRTDEGELLPAALIRGGDKVILEDDADTSAHRVVSTGFDDDDVLTGALDAPPHRAETLIAQLAEAITPIGFF